MSGREESWWLLTLFSSEEKDSTGKTNRCLILCKVEIVSANRRQSCHSFFRFNNFSNKNMQCLLIEKLKIYPCSREMQSVFMARKLAECLWGARASPRVLPANSLNSFITHISFPESICKCFLCRHDKGLFSDAVRKKFMVPKKAISTPFEVSGQGITLILVKRSSSEEKIQAQKCT